jgi:hypothetical protein
MIRKTKFIDPEDPLGTGLGYRKWITKFEALSMFPNKQEDPMTKEEITVGRCVWKAETIPVKVYLDDVFDPPDYPGELIRSRFTLLEVEGAYLVIIHDSYSNKPSKREYKGFMSLDDAKSFLEMFGIEFPKENE